MRNIADIDRIVFSRQQLQDAGYSAHAVRQGILQHELVALRAGVFMRKNDAEQLKPWERYYSKIIAFDRATRCTVFSHDSAAVLHHLAVLGTSFEKVHIYCKPSSRGSTLGAVRHVKLKENTPVVVTDTGILATDIATTLVDCAQTMSFPHALVTAESALNQKKIQLDHLVEFMAGYEGRSRRKVHRVAASLTGLCESPGETLTKIRLEALGIRYIQQYRVVADGREYRADFYLPDYNVFIEFDGNVKYEEYGAISSVLLAERNREKQFLNSGSRVFRTNWYEVFSRPHLFDASLRAFLRLT